MTSVKPGVIPIFVPHLGCPHDCVFCNQKKITGQAHQVDHDQIVKDIEEHLETMDGRRHPIEVAFFGGSFTGIELDKQIEYLKIARRYLQDGHIHGIRLSTRPDYINEEIISRLVEYGVTTIELGVQSLDSFVLDASNRGHTVDDVIEAVKIIKRSEFRYAHKINLGLQMMIGLPEDSLSRSIETAKRIIALEPDFVRIYPTVVIRDTELERLYDEGVYNALSVEHAVEWLSEIIPLFKEAKIPIIRIGLQPTEELTSGESRRAGAYHPSLRQLAQSAIILKKLKLCIAGLLGSYDGSGDVYIRLTAHRKDWTPFRGDKGCNFNGIQATYPKCSFDFVISDDIERGTTEIELEVDNVKKREVIKID